MCGIIGFQGDVPIESLQDGMQAIAHRGPDDSGFFFDPQASVGLGHVRLAIIDLSPLGHQPMEALDGEVQLVFNGEIYNYRELRRDLQARGVTFRSQSDTEVLLQLYLADGPAMLPRLNGIFAFAIFDKRTATTFLARDGLGVKPLYFSATPGAFAFCSELKGLLHVLPNAPELDLVALHRYLTYLWCPGDGTPLRNVRKLGPGEALFVRSGAIVKHWQWYQLPIVQGVARDLTLAEAVTGTADTIRAAVHRQLVADVPVGAFLSGGLDSSAVVAFARERAPDIRCFTIEVGGGAESGTTDDLPYARMVAKHLGVRLEVVEVDAAAMAASLPNMVAQLDEPVADPAPLNALFISQLARETGIKVLLSGAGGDDLFTGYRRHQALALERWWSWLPRRGRAAIEATAARLDQRSPWSRKLGKLTSGATLEGDERIANYFAWIREDVLLALYSPEARACIARHRAAEPLLAFLQTVPPAAPRLERMLALEQRFFLSDHNLMYTDKMSMAVGVEARVPLLDLEVVEFAARVPTRFKQRGVHGKWVFKKAMEPSLPKAAIYRPKTGFGAPVRRWMRHDLRELLGEALGPEAVASRGIFDPSAVARLIAQNDRGEADASYTLLSMLSIELWCRHFVDRALAA